MQGKCREIESQCMSSLPSSKETIVEEKVDTGVKHKGCGGIVVHMHAALIDKI